MVSQRLQELIDGKLQPVGAAPPLLSSADAPWSGFLMERDVCRNGSAQSIVYPHTELILVQCGSIGVEDQALQGSKRFIAREGSITLWPAGHEARSISWQPRCPEGDTAEMTRLHLDLAVLQRLAPDDGPLLERAHVQQSGITDPALATLVRLMLADIEAGCSTGPMYGEYLCLALTAHVAARYATRSASEPTPRGGLAPRLLSRVQGYIEAYIANPLTLTELAHVAGLSPKHFAVAFRKSLGSTPHQYVLRRRMKEAQRLLAEGQMSIADIAAALGFASQSHFTEVFHRTVSTTPGRYRQALTPARIDELTAATMPSPP